MLSYVKLYKDRGFSYRVTCQRGLSILIDIDLVTSTLTDFPNVILGVITSFIIYYLLKSEPNYELNYTLNYTLKSIVNHIMKYSLNA